MAEGNILNGAASNEKLLAYAFLFAANDLHTEYIIQTVNIALNIRVAGTCTLQTQPAPWEFGHLLP